MALYFGFAFPSTATLTAIRNSFADPRTLAVHEGRHGLEMRWVAASAVRADSARAGDVERMAKMVGLRAVGEPAPGEHDGEAVDFDPLPAGSDTPIPIFILAAIPHPARRAHDRVRNHRAIVDDIRERPHAPAASRTTSARALPTPGFLIRHARSKLDSYQVGKSNRAFISCPGNDFWEAWHAFLLQGNVPVHEHDHGGQAHGE